MLIHTHTVNKKIGIGLVGYQSRREIPRCLDPWVGNIDAMILIDGKFTHYDSPNDYSTDGWLEYAKQRYGDKCEVITDKYAGLQIDKRQRYLDLAGDIGCDFLIAVDTDEYIMPAFRDWDKFYRQLYHISEATEDRIFYQWVYIPDKTLWPTQGNKFPTNMWRRSMKIHKDPGSMRFCCNTHFVWCAKGITDEEIFTWQLKATKGLEDDEIKALENPFTFQCRNTIDGVRATMDRRLRSKEQQQRGYDWAIKNSHEELARQHYTFMKLRGEKPPINFETNQPYESWEAFAEAPHTFDIKTGMRKDLKHQNEPQPRYKLKPQNNIL